MPSTTSAEPIAHQARIMPYGSSVNFRHLGGYAAADGRRTSAASLFRTGWPDLTDQTDSDRFQNLGITHIFDFRTDSEIARQGDALPDPATYQIARLPIEQGSMAGYLQSMSTQGSPEATRSAMTLMYREMVRDGARQFARLLEVASRDGGPLMISCTLGKDRTGVASALLLKALGVADDDIFEDYLISASVFDPLADQLYSRMGMEKLGVGLDVVHGVLTVHEQYLAAAWDEMTQAHGSVSEFICSRLGLSDEARERLRSHYTTPAAQ